MELRHIGEASIAGWSWSITFEVMLPHKMAVESEVYRHADLQSNTWALAQLAEHKAEVER